MAFARCRTGLPLGLLLLDLGEFLFLGGLRGRFLFLFLGVLGFHNGVSLLGSPPADGRHDGVFSAGLRMGQSQ